jgi:hypothetical protein
MPGEESDLLVIRPLGAGQEVGRSCIMLEFKGENEIVENVICLNAIIQLNVVQQRGKSCWTVESILA